MKVQNFLMIALTLIMLVCFSESASILKNKAFKASPEKKHCWCTYNFSSGARLAWWDAITILDCNYSGCDTSKPLGETVETCNEKMNITDCGDDKHRWS